MLQAQEIMTQNVVTIRGSATVADAVKLMKEKKLRGLIVEPRHEQDPYGIAPKPTSFTKWRPLATILKLCGS